MTSAAATMEPQSAIATGLARTARIDVAIAVAAPTFLSSSKGKATTEVVSTTMPNSKPMALPKRISL